MKVYNKNKLTCIHDYENYIEEIVKFGNKFYYLWKICKKCNKEVYKEINNEQYEIYENKGIKEKYTKY